MVAGANVGHHEVLRTPYTQFTWQSHAIGPKKKAGWDLRWLEKKNHIDRPSHRCCFVHTKLGLVGDGNSTMATPQRLLWSAIGQWVTVARWLYKRPSVAGKPLQRYDCRCLVTFLRSPVEGGWIGFHRCHTVWIFGDRRSTESLGYSGRTI